MNWKPAMHSLLAFKGWESPFNCSLPLKRSRLELAQFQRVEDLDARELNARYFANRTDRLNLLGRSANIVCAWR